MSDRYYDNLRDSYRFNTFLDRTQTRITYYKNNPDALYLQSKTRWEKRPYDQALLEYTRETLKKLEGARFSDIYGFSPSVGFKGVGASINPDISINAIGPSSPEHLATKAVTIWNQANGAERAAIREGWITFMNLDPNSPPPATTADTRLGNSSQNAALATSIELLQRLEDIRKTENEAVKQRAREQLRADIETFSQNLGGLIDAATSQPVWGNTISGIGPLVSLMLEGSESSSALASANVYVAVLYQAAQMFDSIRAKSDPTYDLIVVVLEEIERLRDELALRFYGVHESLDRLYSLTILNFANVQSQLRYVEMDLSGIRRSLNEFANENRLLLMGVGDLVLAPEIERCFNVSGLRTSTALDEEELVECLALSDRIANDAAATSALYTNVTDTPQPSSSLLFPDGRDIGLISMSRQRLGNAPIAMDHPMPNPEVWFRFSQGFLELVVNNDVLSNRDIDLAGSIDRFIESGTRLSRHYETLFSDDAQQAATESVLEGWVAETNSAITQIIDIAVSSADQKMGSTRLTAAGGVGQDFHHTLRIEETAADSTLPLCDGFRVRASLPDWSEVKHQVTLRTFENPERYYFEPIIRGLNQRINTQLKPSLESTATFPAGVSAKLDPILLHAERLNLGTYSACISSLEISDIDVLVKNDRSQSSTRARGFSYILAIDLILNTNEAAEGEAPKPVKERAAVVTLSGAFDDIFATEYVPMLIPAVMWTGKYEYRAGSAYASHKYSVQVHDQNKNQILSGSAVTIGIVNSEGVIKKIGERVRDSFERDLANLEQDVSKSSMELVLRSEKQALLLRKALLSYVGFDALYMDLYSEIPSTDLNTPNQILTMYLNDETSFKEFRNKIEGRVERIPAYTSEVVSLKGSQQVPHWLDSAIADFLQLKAEYETARSRPLSLWENFLTWFE